MNLRSCLHTRGLHQTPGIYICHSWYRWWDLWMVVEICESLFHQVTCSSITFCPHGLGGQFNGEPAALKPHDAQRPWYSFGFNIIIKIKIKVCLHVLGPLLFPKKTTDTFFWVKKIINGQFTQDRQSVMNALQESPILLKFRVLNR